MSWQPVDLSSVEFEKPSEPPDIAGLVYSWVRTVMSGPPETLKTIAVWILAQDHIRAGGKVAVVDFEMGPFATRRLLLELGYELDEVRDIAYFEPTGPPTGDDIKSIIDTGVTLVIIDAAAGAYDVSGFDDNARKDVERFARRWIKALYAAGIGTVTLDHVTKNSEARGKFTIGSERKVGQCDLHLGLEIIGTPFSRGGTATVRFHVHKDRPGHLKRPYAAELELTSDPDTHAITWTWKQPATATDNGWRPTILMERASQYLERHDEPQSRNSIENGVQGKSRKHIRQAIDHLIAEGFATEEPGPRGARLVRLIKPYTTSPHLAPTSPGEHSHDLAHLARPL